MIREAEIRNEEHDRLWSKELYSVKVFTITNLWDSKFWNREYLKPTPFQRVEITREHYNELQDILNRKYADSAVPAHSTMSC